MTRIINRLPLLATPTGRDNVSTRGTTGAPASHAADSATDHTLPTDFPPLPPPPHFTNLARPLANSTARLVFPQLIDRPAGSRTSGLTSQPRRAPPTSFAALVLLPERSDVGRFSTALDLCGATLPTGAGHLDIATRLD